jgi:hypothetical protein
MLLAESRPTGVEVSTVDIPADASEVHSYNPKQCGITRTDSNTSLNARIFRTTELSTQTAQLLKDVGRRDYKVVRCSSRD